MLPVVKTKNGELCNELIRKNGDLKKSVRETAKALEMANQGNEMMAGDNSTAQGGEQDYPAGTIQYGTTGLRAAQADQQLSYVALNVETKPTHREFFVRLRVRTVSGF